MFVKFLSLRYFIISLYSWLKIQALFTNVLMINQWHHSIIAQYVLPFEVQPYYFIYSLTESLIALSMSHSVTNLLRPSHLLHEVLNSYPTAYYISSLRMTKPLQVKHYQTEFIHPILSPTLFHCSDYINGLMLYLK